MSEDARTEEQESPKGDLSGLSPEGLKRVARFVEFVRREEVEKVVAVLQASAGAWSDEGHPDLESREDIVRFVRTLRAGFERAL